MLPFSIRFRPGFPVGDQVLYAVRKAVAAGQLRPGDPFPSVRVLSQELRVNPNTAHRVVASLVADGLLEVRHGLGTVVAAATGSTKAERRQLLGQAVERLVVDAKVLALELRDVLDAVEAHWHRLRSEKP
jgi:GntR family transcriptional regulator